MLSLKDIVTLFESKARIKILIVLWILAGVFLFVGMPLKWVPFTAFSVWGLVETAFGLKDRNQGKEIKAAVASHHRLIPEKVFEGLSTEALGIVRFWTLQGNRFKTQNLNYMNADVQALERATVIKDDVPAVLSFGDGDGYSDYKISEWAATFLENYPATLNRINRMNLNDIDIKNIVVEYLTREKRREHFLDFDELDRVLSLRAGSSKRVIAQAAIDAHFQVKSLGDKTAHLKKSTVFTRG